MSLPTTATSSLNYALAPASIAKPPTNNSIPKPEIACERDRPCLHCCSAFSSPAPTYNYPR